MQPYGIHTVGDVPLLTDLLSELGIAYANQPVLPVWVTQTLNKDVMTHVQQGGVVVAVLPRIAPTHHTEYSVYHGSHVPFPYDIERIGTGLILKISQESLSYRADHQRNWHKVGLQDRAYALVPATSVAKDRILQFFADMLRIAFAHLNLPLVHLWFFPHKARTHFTIRVDADWYDEQEWVSTRQFLAPLGSHASWFLTCRDVARQPDVLKPLIATGVEIGSHSYYHYTFKDVANNATNIQMADHVLRTHGIDVQSFVSPSAKWNPALQQTIEQQTYLYSSEFNYAHDAYPLTPSLPRGTSASLQVPVHPVCPINFSKFPNQSSEGIHAYYRVVARSLYDRGLPLHLYGHPSDLPLLEGSGLLEDILSWPHLSVSTLREYASWWKMRLKPLTLSYERSADATVRFATEGSLDSSHSFALSTKPYEVILKDGSSFEWSPASAPTYTLTANFPSSFVFEPIHRSLNLRSKIGEWLDFEYIVPAADYKATTLKTGVNKILKKIHRIGV